MRAVAFLLPNFLASMALTIFTSCESEGLTAMKRSAVPTPASFRTWIDEGLPRTVMMSALALRYSSLSLSASMTVISFDSLLSILARCDPTSPAPAMTIFILDYIL